MSAPPPPGSIAPPARLAIAASGRLDSVNASDFVATRPNSSAVNGVDRLAAACHGWSASSGSPEIDHALGLLRSARSHNFACVGMCAVIVAVSLAVVWFVASTLVDLFAEWRAHSYSPSSLRVVEDPDDVVYASRAEDVDSDGYPERTEAAAVASRNAVMSKRYWGYNQAMRRRAANRGDDAADDLVDGHVLSRDDDDFRYPRRPRDDRLRFRKGEGQDVVYIGGGVGLRSPVYKNF